MSRFVSFSVERKWTAMATLNMSILGHGTDKTRVFIRVREIRIFVGANTAHHKQYLFFGLLRPRGRIDGPEKDPWYAGWGWRGRWVGT